MGGRIPGAGGPQGFGNTRPKRGIQVPQMRQIAPSGQIQRPMEPYRPGLSTRAATFPNNPNPPDPIPGSHSTVGPQGLPAQPNFSQDLQGDPFYNELFGDFLQGSTVTSPGQYFDRPVARPPMSVRPPARPPIVARPPARPPVVAKPPAKPPAKKPGKLPARPPVRRPSPLQAPLSPYLAADRGLTSGSQIYGGAGFNGGGGAFTSAANDAFSFSGSRPGMGMYSGPNPGPTDPDYGYTN